KSPKSTFFQLLHLAIYDNVIESPESGADIMLLHLLLTNLIERLGVNAVRPGLPMIFKLQEVALNNGSKFTARAKVNIATVIHGYLLELSEKFDLETTRVGYEIQSEISRRKRAGIWLEKIRVPAVSIEHIGMSLPFEEMVDDISGDAAGTLKPFLNRQDLVL